MLVTNTLIAGGVLYGGLKVIKKEQEKKKTPWTFYAKKMEERNWQTFLNSRQRARKKSILPLSQMASVKEALTRFKEEQISPFFASPRDEQLKEISSTLDESQVNEADRKLNRDLAISSVSLALTSAGPLFYPPLSLLSLPSLLWINFVVAKDAYHSFKQGRGIGADAIGALFHTGAILTGNYFAAALGGCFSRFSKKLLLKTEDYSRQSLINVFGNQTRFVWLLSNDVEVQVPVDQLTANDLIVIHAGETIAVDGTIISGTATIDQHILTGESQPAEKKVGEQVFASTVVLSGNITVCVEKAGEETVAAQIGEILNQTADFKEEILSWGESIADTSARMTIGFSALVSPFFGATAGVTILSSSFGFYMRVLGPLSMLTYLNLASQQGILVKDGRSLQLLTEIDTVVFDKTGTLTEEVPHIAKIHTWIDVSEEELLTYAAAAEYKQTHPIARAILGDADERALSLPTISDATYKIGYGLQVTIPNHNTSFTDQTNGFVDGAETKTIRVGSARFMEMENIAIGPDIKQLAEACVLDGHSLVYVAINDQLAGAIELHATIRPSARQVVSELRKRNINMYIISGDHEQPTKRLAQELGIDNYFAETLPENKASLVAKLQEEGKSVCFVGDGINDSIALKKANVSISLRGASSAATDSAQLVLMNQDLNQLIAAFEVAQNFKNNMKLNLTTTIIPGMITLFGVFFLGFGVAHSVILNDIGVVIGASNAIGPFFREQRKRQALSS